MTIDFDNLTSEQVILFESGVEEIVNDYNSISSTIISEYKDKRNGVELLFSNVTSRNVNYSKFLFYLKCLRLLSKLQPERGDTVIVTNNTLYKTIKSCAPNFTIKYNKSVSKLRVLFSQSVRKIGVLWMAVQKFTYYYLSKSKKRKEKIINTKGITLVDSFLHENSVSNKKYIDRYYCQMLNYIEPVDDNIFYFLLYLPLPSFRNAEDVEMGSTTNIIYPFDLLKIRDYLYALRFPFKRFKLRNDYQYCGFNLMHIIKECSNSWNRYFMFGPLYYRFLLRAKKEGADIKHVVDWYENQSYDRGLYLGMKDFYPNSSIYAFFGYITDQRSSPHVVPTKAEYEAGVAPKVIFTCNEWLRKTFAEKSGYAECHTMSSFRADRIWSLQRKPSDAGQFNLLVPLSAISDEASFKIKLLDTYITASKCTLSIMLKPHPDMDKAFIDSLINGNKRIKTVYGSIYDFLDNVDAIVATDSSVLYESLAVGVPVLSLFDRGGNFNCYKPDIVTEDMWFDIYTPDDFDRSIRYISKKGREYYNELGESLKNLLFEPITKKNVCTLLKKPFN